LDFIPEFDRGEENTNPNPAQYESVSEKYLPIIP
jgi:hypothetical protein